MKKQLLRILSCVINENSIIIENIFNIFKQENRHVSKTK